MEASRSTRPRVGVIMGSLSDYEAVKPALDLFEAWGVPYETTVASSHRTPKLVEAWAADARERGLVAIVAAAGGAAHLPGYVAAHSTLPVIGIPIDSSPIAGVDALYSIAQMPPGVPVATVGINNAVNAAVLALQMLARVEERWEQTILDYREGMRAKVEAQNEELRGRRPNAVWDFGEDESEAEDEDDPGEESADEDEGIGAGASRAFDDDDGGDGGENQSEYESGNEGPPMMVRPIELAQPLRPPPGAKTLGNREQPAARPARREPARSSARGGRYYGRIRVQSDLLPIETAELAVDCLMEGGVIAIPTDTVYGLAVDATNPEAVERLYALKGRDPEKAIAVFIDSQRLLAPLVRNLSIDIRRMMEAFWPGPLTVVFERRPGEFDHLSTGPTIGVRLPDHSIPLTIMQELRRPVACTSANPSGQAPAMSAAQVEKYFGRNVNMIVDVGELPPSPVSTVLDVSAAPFRILREGAVSRDQISAVVGDLLENPDEEE